jgi:tRNA A37 threonylcarbamoyladenosine modification protein TsaB
MSIEQEIPFEINDHLKIFDKEAKDVDYNGVGPGPFCGSRIDQFNFCACGGKLVVD